LNTLILTAIFADTDTIIIIQMRAKDAYKQKIYDMNDTADVYALTKKNGSHSLVKELYVDLLRQPINLTHWLCKVSKTHQSLIRIVCQLCTVTRASITVGSGPVVDR